MKTANSNTTLIDGYLKLLANLSPGNKIDLISRLSQTVKADINKNNKSFYQAFGAWKGNQSAEQIINEVRNSRTFSRKTEELFNPCHKEYQRV